MSTNLEQLKQSYLSDGYFSGVSVVSASKAARHREALERAETRIGPLHYKTKVHTILKSPFELATLPHVLDIVEGLIGPDILLYNVTYIIKEPNTPSHVSWHQDLPNIIRIRHCLCVVRTTSSISNRIFRPYQTLIRMH
jgi:hypothetical protein